MRALETFATDHSELVFWVGLTVLVCWFCLQQRVRIWSPSAVVLFRTGVAATCLIPMVVVSIAAVRSFDASSSQTEYGQAQLCCLSLFLIILYVQNAVRLVFPPRNRTVATDLDVASRSGR